MKAMKVSYLLVFAAIPLALLLAAAPAQSSDWSISLWGGGGGGYYSTSPYYGGYYGNSGYYGNRGYYPYYRPYNPVVRRDTYGGGGYAPDGTYHSEGVVEDRHASYYSPGRNQAITRPRTSVQSWNYGSGQRTRERTSWIGADGRPHSTTIDRNTYVDPWGNTQTDTHVTLKKKPSGQGANTGTSGPAAPPAAAPAPAPMAPPASAPVSPGSAAPSASPGASN